jgi:hypothetical protein
MLVPVQAEYRELYVGQNVEVVLEFRRDGEPINPTIVYVRVKAPSGGITVIPKESMTNPMVGEFVATVLLVEAGRWSFRIEGAGAVDAVTEIPDVEVRPTAVS